MELTAVRLACCFVTMKIFMKIIILLFYNVSKLYVTKPFVWLWQHHPDPPNSVVLVGHSMGGVIARALFSLPRFNPRLVSLILTQSSPHQAPVLSLDPFILGRKVLKAWHSSYGQDAIYLLIYFCFCCRFLLLCQAALDCQSRGFT